MTQNAVSKVKAVDPSIKLITDDDLYVTHYWYLEKGLPQEIAGFAIHPYTINAPEHAAVNYDTDWCMPWHVVDVDNTMSSGVHRLKEQGQLKLNKFVEIWSTEQGWWQGDPEWETNAAMWLPRAFIHAASARVKATCWFSSMDVTDGPMGLRTNEGIPRKSYAAFKTMTRQLGDYVLDHQTEGLLDSYGLQSYVFKGPTGDTKVVVWVVDIGAQGVYRIPDTQGVTAVDLGNPVEVYSEMLIGNAPVYLSGIKTTSIFP